MLTYVVLNVATARGTENNFFYGLAIGFTVLAGAVAVGGISGGAFNPAVAVGVATAGLGPWGNVLPVALSTLAGGSLAAGVFRLLNPHDT